MRETPRQPSPEVPRKLEILLKQSRWDEAEQIVGREAGAPEKLVAKLLKDYLRDHHPVRGAIQFSLSPAREED
jgi:hypothetical protein